MEKAVRSVLTQTFSDIEVIVVNDGSSDDTADRLRDLAQEDSRLFYISNETSRGAPVCRNMAIRASRGEFVTGLDDDDLFLPERIKTFVKYWDLLVDAGETPSCLYAQEFPLGDEGMRKPSQRPGCMTVEDLFVANRIGGQFFAPRRHFLEAGLFDEQFPVWQDLEFLIRMLKMFGPARLLDLPTYVFDDTTRGDRISIQRSRVARNARVRKAFSLTIQKHPFITMRQRQELMLQVFSDYYGIRPRVEDFLHFLRCGWWGEGSYTLFRAAVRRSAVRQL